MVADLLNRVRVEVTGIALEGVADGEGVLHATKHRANDVAEDTTLAQLKELIILLGIAVDGLDPALVLVDRSIIDMVFELDDIGVGDVVGVHGAQDGGRVVVNGLGAERGRLGDGRQGECGNGPQCVVCQRRGKERVETKENCSSDAP